MRPSSSIQKATGLASIGSAAQRLSLSPSGTLIRESASSPSLEASAIRGGLGSSAVDLAGNTAAWEANTIAQANGANRARCRRYTLELVRFSDGCSRVRGWELYFIASGRV